MGLTKHSTRYTTVQVRGRQVESDTCWNNMFGLYVHQDEADESLFTNTWMPNLSTSLYAGLDEPETHKEKMTTDTEEHRVRTVCVSDEQSTRHTSTQVSRANLIHNTGARSCLGQRANSFTDSIARIKMAGKGAS
jgi:hypothetical protein